MRNVGTREYFRDSVSCDFRLKGEFQIGRNEEQQKLTRSTGSPGLVRITADLSFHVDLINTGTSGIVPPTPFPSLFPN